MRIPVLSVAAAAILLTLGIGGCGQGSGNTENAVTLYNVSYDPTRQLYVDINDAFSTAYQAEHGKSVTVKMFHGGSGKQSHAVIDGAQADVVTLALAADIDAIAEKAKMLPADWQAQLPHNSAPYTSTIVFLVRKGNPKAIHDWPDVIKPGVSVITPDPKSSGGARWNYLAAWGYMLKTTHGDQAQARAFVAELYKHVPVLDSGARGSTVTFAQRNEGDVLLAWENEAFLALKEFGSDKFEIVAPSLSILAEPPVAVVKQNAEADNVAKEAEAYLRFLYTKPAQEIIAKNFYRPRDPEIAKKYESQFQKMELFTIDDLFGGWKEAQKTHFADGGIYDQIFKK